MQALFTNKPRLIGLRVGTTLRLGFTTPLSLDYRQSMAKRTLSNLEWSMDKGTTLFSLANRQASSSSTNIRHPKRAVLTPSLRTNSSWTHQRTWIRLSRRPDSRQGSDTEYT